MGHHFVPQRYLQRFELPNRPGFVFVHDRRGDAPRAAAIKKVAQQSGFYDAAIEKTLADEVELPANRIVDGLLAQHQISGDDRTALARYLAVMLKRVPAQRRRSQAMVPGVLLEVFDETRQALRDAAKDDAVHIAILQQRLRQLDSLQERYSAEPPPELLAKIREPWPTDDVVDSIRAMTWRLLMVCETQTFVTSDDPFVFFRHLGLANAEAEFCLPLTPFHALHGSWQSDDGMLVFVRVKDNIVREVNRRVVASADRLVFGHQPMPWVRTLFAKPPRLNRIRWARRSG